VQGEVLAGQAFQEFILGNLVPGVGRAPAWSGVNEYVAQLHEQVSVLVGLGALVERLSAEQAKDTLELAKERRPQLVSDIAKGLAFLLGQRTAASSKFEVVI
jgi:hypothetical protein